MHSFDQQVGFYFRLVYPLRVVAAGDGFKAIFPDLPGCELWDDDLSRLYARMETVRYMWIADRLREAKQVPLPNSQRYASGIGWQHV